MDDTFNKSFKAKTECMFCHEAICRTCLKTSLLNDRSALSSVCMREMEPYELPIKPFLEYQHGLRRVLLCLGRAV